MPVRARLRAAFQRRATDDSTAEVPVAATTAGKPEVSPEAGRGAEDAVANPEDEIPAEDAQRGVHEVEAVTLTWSKASLIAVFIK
jgi:hypothetical protein